MYFLQPLLSIIETGIEQQFPEWNSVFISNDRPAINVATEQNFCKTIHLPNYLYYFVQTHMQKKYKIKFIFK